MSSDFRNGLIAATVFWFSVLVAIGAFGKLFAGETWVVLSVASHHFDSNQPKDYEQRNLGLGIEHEMTRTIRATAGFYRNSNRTDSLYYGAVWTPLSYGVAKLGIAAELVSGYERKGSREPIKAAFPVLSFEWKDFGINIPYIPRTKHNIAAIGLQLKVRF